MGAKVHIENYMPGHCSMRDPSRESNGASWPSFYTDNNLPNGMIYYGILSRPVADLQLGYDKDIVKQTMLEHEAIFKNQVYELHRLYRVQRDLMDEVRRKEQFVRQIPYEASSSSSPVPSQMQYEDLQRWNGSSPPLASSICGRPISGPDTNIHSSLHSTKGKSIQAAPSPYQSCYSPRNSEVLESRPTKCRRKMLDLQLPADEYIDTDEVEQVGAVKVSDNIIPSPDKKGISGPHLGKSKVLADLNEPLHAEETTAASSVDFLGRAGSQHDSQCRDLSNKFLSTSKDAPQNSWHGSLNGTSRHSPFENGSKGQDWFCYAVESEQHKGGFRLINQGIHDQKPIPSQVVQIPLDQTCQPPAFLSGNLIKGDPWKLNYGGTVQKSDRSYSLSSYNVTDQIRPSHLPNQPSFFHHSDLGKSWDQCASSGDRQSSCLNQKSLQIQTSPFLTSATMSKSPLPPAQSNNLFGNSWNLNSIPRASASFDAEPSPKNGFYQGSSTSVREPPVHFPTARFDHTSCNDKKIPVKDVNLNVAVPNGILNDFNDHKSEDPLTVLPWLRGKAACHNNSDNSRKGSSALEFSQFRGLPLASSSCNGGVKAEKPDGNGCLSSKKILGVPIFESPSKPKENSTIITHSAAECGRKRVVFDMNVPCDPESTDSEPAMEVVIIEKKMQVEYSTLRNHFDLNSCITEEETPCETSLVNNSARVKGGTGIDLEAPVIIESDEEPLVNEAEEQPQREDDSGPELAKSAAEAIMALSSSVNLIPPEEEATCLPAEANLEDALHWFVDIACSNGSDLETIEEGDRSGDNEGCSPRVLDDFESMTLNLRECSAEEYFPKPSFPEVLNVEEVGTCLLATRTRKGQARRGRQRRDFQRDILPGLASLSRHEVTEDLQTFGGLMRATGHPWHSGPNRRNATRNGCARGRRRSVVAAPPPSNTIPNPLKQQTSNNTEVVLEDRSLTGWGKTTRRPRRQRYPAGNPPVPVPLS